MGWPEVAGKWAEFIKIRLQNGAAPVGFSGQIPERLAAVGREILRPTSFNGVAPHGPAHVQ